MAPEVIERLMQIHAAYSDVLQETLRKQQRVKVRMPRPLGPYISWMLLLSMNHIRREPFTRNEGGWEWEKGLLHLYPTH